MASLQGEGTPIQRDGIEAQLDLVLSADRVRLRKAWHGIEAARRAGKPYDRNLARFEAELAESLARRERRAASRPTFTFDDALPITARREEIARAIAEHPVVIVCGETGSGKSTQLPKICLELGRGVSGLIGHTQPRRIAARAIATRLSEELNSQVGQAVGFKIRFTDTTSPQTFVKLMTDGILLAETQHDLTFSQYDTLIIDEAHERSLNIDFLLGLIKRVQPRRPDLKTIITSATIDAVRFAEHFATSRGPAPILEVSDRTFPVEVRYRPPAEDEEDPEDPDWMSAVLDGIDEARLADPGDVLVFLPTERDIHECAKLLRARIHSGQDRGTEILPLYARLSAADQSRVFHPGNRRRIILATNVAESSLTVPGIRTVVDSGTARISRYSPRSKMQRLPVEAVSQASANQRAGRCGRVGPGVCFRIYAEQDYLQREAYTPPEIQRSNLASVILQMLSLGFGDVEQFPFLDPPKQEAIRDGCQTLFELGAIDDRRQLTPLGRRLAPLPVDPRIGRIVLAGHDENSLHEILIIAAALEIQDPRERPLEKQQAADEVHKQFLHPESDFLTLLKLWDFCRGLEQKLSRGQLRKACHQNFLSYNRLREWRDVHAQLLELCSRAGLKPHERRDDYNSIHRALLTGLLANIGFKGETFEYSFAGGKGVLWPGSGVFEKKPKWVVAAELIETSKRFLRTVARIDPAWIEPLAAHLVNRSYSEPHWDAERGATMAYEKVTLGGLVIVPRRRVPYGPIAPAVSREMLLGEGLVAGHWQSTIPFFVHNRKLQAELEQMQTKARRGNLLKGEIERFTFYDERIPADAYDGPRLEKWFKSLAPDERQRLFMTPADLLNPEFEEPKPEEFPDKLALRHMEIPLEYKFEPGGHGDGVTLTLPRTGLNQLDPSRLGWLVPGLLEEKVVALIKSLPKPLRRLFVPAQETARQLVRQISFGEGDLTTTLAEHLTRIAREPIARDAFQLDQLPDHLRMNVRIVDDAGKTLAAGRDLSEIRRELGAGSAAEFSAATDPRWNRENITTWDLEAFPAQVEIPRRGLPVIGFPALLDRGECVALRLLDSAEAAAHLTRGGLRRLYYLATKRELRGQINFLPDIDKILLWCAILPAELDWKQQFAELLVDRAFLATGAVPRTPQEFQTQLAAGKSRLGLGVQDLTVLLPALIQSAHQAQVTIEKRGLPNWGPTLADLRAQFTGLTAPGFLVETPWTWLMQFPKYFKGMLLRLQKLNGPGVARDQKLMADFQPHAAACVALMAKHRELGLYDPELATARWMLEEFRISLFAQELGTAIPISAKRMEKQLAKVRQA